MSEAARVLVKEEIADAGVALLQERFDVDVAVEMPADELSERLRDYDALIVRSAPRSPATCSSRRPG